jgi:hypothetical protein
MKIEHIRSRTIGALADIFWNNGEHSGMMATASILLQVQLTIQAFDVLNKKASALPRHIEYGHYLEGLGQILQTEDFRYRFACVKVLSRINIVEKERTHMLNDASLYVWEDKGLEEKLNKSLHKWYGSYTKAVENMLAAFSRIDQLPSLGSNGKISHHVCTNGRKYYPPKYCTDAVQTQTNDEVDFIEGGRRLKLNPGTRVSTKSLLILYKSTGGFIHFFRKLLRQRAPMRASMISSSV